MGKGITASLLPESAQTATLEIQFGDGKSASYPNVPIGLASAVVENPSLYNSEIRGRTFGGDSSGSAFATEITDAVLDVTELL